MSIVKQALVKCSHCGAEHPLQVYKSVNAAQEPALKEKVKDGSLFLWACPKCSKTNLARYECLYHDPDKRLMVWLLPIGSVSEAEMASISLHAKALGGYTLRKVTDVGALMEKVIALDEGLDDVALEICKYVMRQEQGETEGTSGETGRIPAGAPLHFFRREEDKLIFTYPAEGKMQALSVGMNIYENALGILQRNPALRPEEGFQQIDEVWLATVLQ
ncbi:MAG: CpXC domain-containing protein [Bacteroidales bacterium]|nr:CpXC domain-containing protein [Bacteroidales bacterium]